MSLWVKTGVDLSDIESGAGSIRSRIAACSDSVIVRQSIVLSAVESPRPDAVGGAGVERVGALIFSCDSDELCLAEIRGIKDEFLVTTGPGAGILIDQTNATIADLVAEITSGIWSNPFAFDISTLESAYLQIRR